MNKVGQAVGEFHGDVRWFVFNGDLRRVLMDAKEKSERLRLDETEKGALNS